jgi:hypothetical protein
VFEDGIQCWSDCEDEDHWTCSRPAFEIRAASAKAAAPVGLCGPSMGEVAPPGFCQPSPSIPETDSGTVTTVTMVPSAACCDVDNSLQDSYSEASTCISGVDGQHSMVLPPLTQDGSSEIPEAFLCVRSPPVTPRVTKVVPRARSETFQSVSPRVRLLPQALATRRCHSEGNERLPEADVQLPRGGSFEVNKASPRPSTPKSTSACWSCLPFCAFFR